MDEVQDIDFREKVMNLQDIIEKMAEGGTFLRAEYELLHYFTPIDKKYGCCQYARVVYLPKGHLIIGKIHRHAHLNFVMKGKIWVSTEFGRKYFEAPCIFISEPGIKRAGFVEEDCIWCTVHLTEHAGEEKLDLIEHEVIAKDYQDLLEEPK